MDLSSASKGPFTARRSHFPASTRAIFDCQRNCRSINRLGRSHVRRWATGALPTVTPPPAPALPEAAPAPAPSVQARAAYMAAPENDLLSKAPRSVQNLVRSTEFFGRVATIYGAYKFTQLRTVLLKLQGKDSQHAAVQKLWDDQHTWAGEQMYELCISLRGFYLKVSMLSAYSGALWKRAKQQLLYKAECTAARPHLWVCGMLLHFHGRQDNSLEHGQILFQSRSAASYACCKIRSPRCVLRGHDRSAIPSSGPPGAASSNDLAGTQGVLLIGALLIQTDTIHKKHALQRSQPVEPHTLQLTRAKNTFSDLQRQGP